MGTQIIFSGNGPREVYDYDKPELQLVVRNGVFHIQQMYGFPGRCQKLDLSAPYLTLHQGFYEGTYKAFVTSWKTRPPASDKATKSFFYVDPLGDVIEFGSRQVWASAYAAHYQGESWALGRTTLPKKVGGPPVPRKLARVPLTRFDHLDRDIVEELKPPKKPQTTQELDELLAATFKPEPTPPTDDISDAVATFLKELADVNSP